MDRSPGGPFRPEPPLCPPRVGNGHGKDHGGRGPHTVLARRCAPPSDLVRARLRRAGVGSPVGRDPRGSRRRGALGRAVCRSSRIPPPRVAVPSGGGGGGVPSALGGADGRSCGPQAGGSGAGGGWGARPTASRPLAPSGVGLPSVVSGVPPRGILVPWGLPGGRGRPARPGRPPTGQCGGGWGGGGGEPPRPGSRPRLPQAGFRRGHSVCAVLGAAGPLLVGSGQGGSVRAVHLGRLPRPRCPLTPGAATSWGGVRGRRLLGLPLSALGPEGEGGGSRGGPLVPWRRPLTVEGGRPGGPGPGGQPSAGGSHFSPAPLYLEPDPRAGLRWGPFVPPAVVARCWPAGGGREG